MSRRPLLLLLAIAVLGAVGWILLLNPAETLSDEHTSKLTQEITAQAAETVAPEAAITELAHAASDMREQLDAAGPAFHSPQEIGIPSFTGRVLMPNDAPAANARVRAFGLDGWAGWVSAEQAKDPDTVRFEVTTRTDGRFFLPEAPRDGLRFVVQIQEDQAATMELTNQVTSPGRTRDLGDLKLHAGFQLTGTVVDPNGRPIPDATVRPIPETDTAQISNRWRNSVPPIPGYSAITNQNGMFHLKTLPPGRLRLQAEAFGFALGKSEGVRGEDEEVIEEVVVHLDVSRGVTGLVVGPGNTPVAEARVRLDVEEDDRLITFSNEKGLFHFDPPESVSSRPRIRVYARGFRPFSNRMTLKDHGMLTIQLQDLPPLHGVVLDASGRPIEGASVCLSEYRSRRSEGSPSKATASGTATSAADGTFSITPDLTQTWGRTFRIGAWGEKNPGSWSKTFRFEEEAVDQKPFPEFIITLAPGALVGGSVLLSTGAPAPNARIHLRALMANRNPNSKGAVAPDTLRSGRIKSSTTALEDGSFTFEALPEGDYRLEAYVADQSPATGQEFALFVGEEHQEILQIPPASGILGTVSGDLSMFKTLRVTADSQGLDPLDAKVDELGTFEFENITPGVWNLVLREVDISGSTSNFSFGNGDGIARADGIEVREGTMESVELSLDVENRAIIHGSVKVNGAPASNINLFLIPRDITTSGDTRVGWRTLSRRMRSTATDFRGDYLLGGIDPDDYFLVLDHAGDWPQGISHFGEPGAVEFGPRGLHRLDLTLHAGDNRKEDFRLSLGGISGRIQRPSDWGNQRTDFSGGGSLRPGPGAPIGRGERSVEFRNGRFEAKNLPAGEWLLSWKGRGFELIDHPVFVTGGLVTEVKAKAESLSESSNR